MEIRTTFHKNLRGIQDEVLVMGNMVEKAILHSVEALKERNRTTPEATHRHPTHGRKNGTNAAPQPGRAGQA